MDNVLVASIATTVTTLLAPYLEKAGGKLAEEIGKGIPDYVSKLYAKIRSHLSRKPSAEEALTDFEKTPNNEDIQAAFRVQLKKLLIEDEEFAQQISDMLAECKKVEGDATIYQAGSGGVATERGVAAGEGGVAVGGDVRGDVNITGQRD